MATMTTIDTRISARDTKRPATQAKLPRKNVVYIRTQERPRVVSQQSGRAIEMLGHAIQCLEDDFALQSINGDFSRESGDRSGSFVRLAAHNDAIDLLKRLNREVYLSCPLTPTFGEKFRALLGRSPSSTPR